MTKYATPINLDLLIPLPMALLWTYAGSLSMKSAFAHIPYEVGSLDTNI